MVAQTYFENGVASYEQSDFEDAKTLFLKAFENDKNDREALRFVGITYARLGKDGLAVQTLIEADEFITADRKKKPDEGEKYNGAKILSKPGGLFSDVALKDRLQGMMKIVAEFNKNGEVTFFYPYKEINDAMTKSALRFIYRIKFESATKNGNKITIMKVFRFYLTIY